MKELWNESDIEKLAIAYVDTLDVNDGVQYVIAIENVSKAFTWLNNQK